MGNGNVRLHVAPQASDIRSVTVPVIMIPETTDVTKPERRVPLQTANPFVDSNQESQIIATPVPIVPVVPAEPATGFDYAQTVRSQVANDNLKVHEDAWRALEKAGVFDHYFPKEKHTHDMSTLEEKMKALHDKLDKLSGKHQKKLNHDMKKLDKDMEKLNKKLEQNPGVVINAGQGTLLTFGLLLN